MKILGVTLVLGHTAYGIQVGELWAWILRPSYINLHNLPNLVRLGWGDPS